MCVAVIRQISPRSIVVKLTSRGVGKMSTALSFHMGLLRLALGSNYTVRLPEPYPRHHFTMEYRNTSVGKASSLRAHAKTPPATGLGHAQRLLSLRSETRSKPVARSSCPHHPVIVVLARAKVASPQREHRAALVSLRAVASRIRNLADTLFCQHACSLRRGKESIRVFWRGLFVRRVSVYAAPRKPESSPNLQPFPWAALKLGFG